MRRWQAALALAVLVLLWPALARAHLGSPDVFYDGMAGPYPVSVSIHLPGVVPGRAQITVRVAGKDPVSVAVAPIASHTAVSNTPPAEEARPVAGEPNLFSGELWLMTSGAYGIDIRVKGPAGAGAVRVPVDSIATHQLPMPPMLGEILLTLAVVLLIGGIVIIAAAASEGALPVGAAPGPPQRRRYWTAAIISAIVLMTSLVEGKRWWDAEEAGYRTGILDGGWPELKLKIRHDSDQRVLKLRLADGESKPKDLTLALDHGKLLHIYLTRLPNHDAFAHVHPVGRDEDDYYEAIVPPLPEGDYEVLCDLTLAQSGFSSTATNFVHLPAPPAAPSGARKLKADPDDSWVADTSALATARDNPGNDVVCHLADGAEMIWKAHPALREQQDAGLTFEVRDAEGKPAVIEPFMGMSCHAAVLRSDGRVFAHLHPSGNYSMAAQYYFDTKLSQEGARAARPAAGHTDPVCGFDGATLSGAIHLPYQFPTAGDYRLWVQVRSGGKVETGIFDATVQPGSL